MSEHRAGTGNNERYTPPWFVRGLLKALGREKFDVDPCGGCEPEPIAHTTWTKEDDGTSQRWGGITFCNPPYSKEGKEDFTKKAVAEIARDDVDSILFLVQEDSSTGWFKRIISESDYLVTFEKHKRFAFGDNDSSGSFANVMLILGGENLPTELFKFLSGLGTVWEFADVHDPNIDGSGSQQRLSEWATDTESVEEIDPRRWVDLSTLREGDIVEIEIDRELLSVSPEDVRMSSGPAKVIDNSVFDDTRRVLVKPAGEHDIYAQLACPDSRKETEPSLCELNPSASWNGIGTARVNTDYEDKEGLTYNSYRLAKTANYGRVTPLSDNDEFAFGIIDGTQDIQTPGEQQAYSQQPLVAD